MKTTGENLRAATRTTCWNPGPTPQIICCRLACGIVTRNRQHGLGGFHLLLSHARGLSERLQPRQLRYGFVCGKNCRHEVARCLIRGLDVVGVKGSVKQWLKAIKREENLENPTVDKIRRVMNLVFKHGQTYGLIPRGDEANPMKFVTIKTQSEYEAMIISPEEGFKILMAMPQPERILALVIAVTGLRISECLGLQWADIDYENQQISVRRAWTGGRIGPPKSAASKAPVPLGPALAGFIRGWQQQTPYGQPTDWVFPSTRLNGKQPRVANMLVEDYLRPAAVKVGVLKEGEKVRFGYHTLRHSLASFMVRKGTDVKTVQRLLRHSDVTTTLGIYAHSMSEDRLAAQGDMLEAMMKPPSDAVN